MFQPNKKTELLTEYGNIDVLAEFTGTSLSQVTCKPLNEYRQCIVSIFDINGMCVNSVTFPIGTWTRDLFTIKIYGADSDTWGSVYPNGYTVVSFNRTSTTTTKVVLFGVK